MPLFYHKIVNYVSSHSVNYLTTLYSLLLPFLYHASKSTQIASFLRKLFGVGGRGDERLIPCGINFASFLSKTLRLACSSRLPMKKYYRVNVVGHNDVILNRNTSETRFYQLQLLFYNLAARLQFYRDFGRSKPLPYRFCCTPKSAQIARRREEQAPPLPVTAH